MAKINRDCYAVKIDSKSESAELTLYGNVVKERPLEWDGQDIVKSTENYIVEKEFLDDLGKIGKCKKLNIRINSLGGNVYVALNIHNRLRDLAKNGTEITCSVDGVAMSAGSMIMCAADKVTASESSLIMIHRSMLFLDDYYNADELREQAEIQDEHDKAIAACYKRKTGKSESELLEMMSRETFMTGAEAKEQGFVDELMDSENALEIVACADKKSLMVGGRIFDLMGAPIPQNLPTVAFPKPQSGTGVTNTKPTGGNEIMAKNYDELLKENPELAAAIKEELMAKAKSDNDDKAKKAVEEERKRIAAIDEIANQCSPELVSEAKYGEKACSAEQLAYRMLLENEKKGKSYLDGLKKDAEASGVENVQATPAPEDKNTDDVRARSLDFMDSVLKEEEK